MASTIKVDNVQNQPGTNIVSKCGTDVTLGASGDTVALAAGASQTGFGRTGTVDWVTTPKVTGDSPVTGVTGKGYFLNTTAGTITVNLPAGAAGSIVSLADYAETWNTYNVTVASNGSEKIGGATTDAVLNTKGQSVTLVYVDSTQGWINTMDSTSNVRGQSPYIVATGGTPSSGTIVCTNYRQHTFTGPGTLKICNVAACAADDAVAYLVVAGGGGGGGNATGDNAAGGGAGGFREGTTAPVVPYTASPLVAPAGLTVTATSYPITVGAGGAGGCSGVTGNGVQGSSAIFSTITSAGGGGGGAGNPSGIGPSGRTGGAGGSGGGAGGGSGPNNSGGAGNTPPTTPSQGLSGGNSSPPSGGDSGGGGGGGATEAGATATPCVTGGGRGGAGVPTQITGSALSYAGGAGTGCGAASPCGTGGAGGNGGAGTAGTVNRGGGAGGSRCHGANGAAIGGSGVVIIRYRFQ